LAPTEGRAAICGHDVTDDPIRARRNLGYLPEGAPLYGDMTAGAFLAFIAAMRGLSGRRGRAAVGLAVERTALAEVLAQPIDTLSKGFKRRVGLAQALLHDPPALILDEPTDGLDPNQKHEMRALIREIRPSKAIVISTHILEEVDAVCTRAAIISGGRLLADAAPAELAAWSPLHNAVSLTLGAQHADAAAASLGGLERVEAVHREPAGPNAVRLTALSRDGGPILTDVGLLVQAHGWEAGDLRTETGALDDVFRRMTQPGEEAPRNG
ncbi:MAG: ATP-binding cassette domain-containing protein, partial [Alphaproteobacteria bacterium]|nr:ATP-binding cassette domain-containing protein [Alphaproteobacteria bacterium]